ncbi:MAG: hypothetical protein AAF219_01065 [Myxococcota bacterium]
MVRTITFCAVFAVGLSEVSALPGIEKGNLPMQLPELGSQRRVVMSEMRRAGFELLESEGDTLVFAGAPPGWMKATTTTYVFRHLVAEEVRVDYIDVPNTKHTARVYSDVKRRLSDWFGAPWLDRVPQGRSVRGPLRTTWESPGLFAQLSTERKPINNVSVSVKRSAHFNAKREVESVKGDDMPYDAAQAYVGLSTSAKGAMEALFDDFGEMRLVLEGAKSKGAPLKVSLSEISLPPEELKGVDRMLFERRFFQLISGHWNLEPAGDGQPSDVELKVSMVPTRVKGKQSYAIRLDAFVQDAGANKSKKRVASRRVYSASHRL